MPLSKTEKHSTRINLWVPKMLHQELKEFAELEDTTMSYVVTGLLMEFFGLTPDDVPGRRPARTKFERKEQMYARRQRRNKTFSQVTGELVNNHIDRECNNCGSIFTAARDSKIKLCLICEKEKMNHSKE